MTSGKTNTTFQWGFRIDYYVTPEQYEETPKTDREQLLLKAMVLSDEQAKKYASCISPLPDFGTYHYSDAEYFADCLTLQAASCSSFSHDNTGFTAEISALSSELVFFSVPYESGWTATVNGEPVDVEKVSVGFMAVQVPAGDNTIRFEYETPGLKLGLLCQRRRTASASFLSVPRPASASRPHVYTGRIFPQPLSLQTIFRL